MHELGGRKGFRVDEAGFLQFQCGFLRNRQSRAAPEQEHPTEEEYRALRVHVDDNVPLPQSAPFAAVSGTARELLGHPFDPAITRYRAMIHHVYAASMGESAKAIESRLTRARQAFREVYEADHD